MSFTFYDNIPAANNNPSNDQPLMLQNNVTENAIWNVDHVTFNDEDAGKHKQVTFISEFPPGGLPTDKTSILYTNVGSASTIAQLLFANQNQNFLISGVRAFGNFAGIAAPGPVTATNSYNVSTIALTTGGGNDIYTITLNAGATNGNNVTVLWNINRPTQNTVYSFIANVLTLNFGVIGSTNGNLINFLVLQY